MLIWDPNRIFFKIPFIGYPITWYGCFFAAGFMVGYVILCHILTEVLAKNELHSVAKKRATAIMDKFGIIGAICAVLGARIGYILFYGLPDYLAHPLDIFKVWQGGLASHGAAIAVLFGILYFVRKNREYTFFFMLDALVIAASFVGGMIRIGNFMNQEITGLPTEKPWGVTFLHPMDNVAGIPLHPVQLYESLSYFVLFIALYTTWRLRGKEIGSGVTTGLFFVALFTCRFFIEFLKVPQGIVLPADFPLRMGQILSIPFVIAGVFLLLRARRQHVQA